MDRLRARPVLLGLVVWILLAPLVTIIFWAMHTSQRHLASKLNAHGVTTLGTATRTEPYNHDGVFYSYTVDGRTYHSGDSADGPEGDTRQLTVGQSIHVVYDAEDPATSCYCRLALLTRDSAWWTALFGGLPIASIAAIGITRGICRRSSRDQPRALPTIHRQDRPSPQGPHDVGAPDGRSTDPIKATVIRAIRGVVLSSVLGGAVWALLLGTFAFRLSRGPSGNGTDAAQPGWAWMLFAVAGVGWAARCIRVLRWAPALVRAPPAWWPAQVTSGWRRGWRVDLVVPVAGGPDFSAVIRLYLRGRLPAEFALPEGGGRILVDPSSGRAVILSGRRVFVPFRPL